MEAKLYHRGFVFFGLLVTVCLAMDGESVGSFSPGKLNRGKSQISVSPSKDGGCLCDISKVMSQLTELQGQVQQLQSSLATEATKRRELEQSFKEKLLSENIKLARLQRKEAEARVILKRRVTTLEQSVLIGKKGKPTVAFSARVTTSLDNLKRKQKIVFGTVKTNIGACYKKKSGKFRCPVSGLYQFFVTIVSYNKKSISTVLQVNGAAQIYIWSVTNKKESGSMASNTVILKLQKNDMVWVQVLDHKNNGDSVYAWSTFSGHLLHAN